MLKVARLHVNELLVLEDRWLVHCTGTTKQDPMRCNNPGCYQPYEAFIMQANANYIHNANCQ